MLNYLLVSSRVKSKNQIHQKSMDGPIHSNHVSPMFPIFVMKQFHFGWSSPKLTITLVTNLGMAGRQLDDDIDLVGSRPRC